MPDKDRFSNAMIVIGDTFELKIIIPFDGSRAVFAYNITLVYEVNVR